LNTPGRHGRMHSLSKATAAAVSATQRTTRVSQGGRHCLLVHFAPYIPQVKLLSWLWLPLLPWFSHVPARGGPRRPPPAVGPLPLAPHT
jgi:hypothetical protein